MARFRAYKMASSKLVVLDLQADLLDDLKTRVIVPLYPVAELSWSMPRLNPRFAIRGELHVMATQRMAAVPAQDLGELIADLSAYRDEILAATDFLFQGF
jgi:toxin CcdB